MHVSVDLSITLHVMIVVDLVDKVQISISRFLGSVVAEIYYTDDCSNLLSAFHCGYSLI